MFRFHHSSHLQVVSTRHHEQESILIGYPFRAQSSRPRVLFFIYDPESFIFHLEPRALDLESFSIYNPESFLFHLEPKFVFHLWPQVISFPFMTLSNFFSIYDPESFLFYLEPKALDPNSFSIYNPESFLFHLEPKVVFHLWPRVISFPFMTPSHFFSIYDPKSFLFHLEPRALDLESFSIYDPESFLFHLEPRALDPKSFSIYDLE